MDTPTLSGHGRFPDSTAHMILQVLTHFVLCRIICLSPEDTLHPRRNQTPVFHEVLHRGNESQLVSQVSMGSSDCGRARLVAIHGVQQQMPSSACALGALQFPVVERTFGCAWLTSSGEGLGERARKKMLKGVGDEFLKSGEHQRWPCSYHVSCGSEQIAAQKPGSDSRQQVPTRLSKKTRTLTSPVIKMKKGQDQAV